MSVSSANLGTVWNMDPEYDQSGTERKWESQDGMGKPGLIISNKYFESSRYSRWAIVPITSLKRNQLPPFEAVYFHSGDRHVQHPCASSIVNLYRGNVLWLEIQSFARPNLGPFRGTLSYHIPYIEEKFIKHFCMPPAVRDYGVPEWGDIYDIGFMHEGQEVFEPCIVISPSPINGRNPRNWITVLQTLPWHPEDKAHSLSYEIEITRRDQDEKRTVDPTIIRTIDCKKRNVRKLGELSPNQMNKISERMAFILFSEPSM